MPRRKPPLLTVALAAALGSPALAQQYTLTFEDLPNQGLEPYNPANVVPANYAPAELVGSGITVGFTGFDPVTLAPQPVGVFYGDPISPNNDHTPFGSGANLYNIGGIELTFNQPIYLASAWVDIYANFRDVTIAGYTNAVDTTPVLTTTVTAPLHEEPWREGADELKWRDVIHFGATPVTRLTFYSDGFVQLDDLTLSTTPVDVLFGDFNRNGLVEDGDYTVWADTYGQEVDLRADANGNGIVDDGDYTAWADTYGQGSLLPTATLFATPGSFVVIPEPATAALAALASLALLRRRH